MKTLLPILVLAVATPALFLGVRGARAQANSTTAPAIRVTNARPPQSASTEHFTGTVELSGSFQAAPPARAGGATVAFSPGARTDWHTHPLGQTLIVTEGTGRVQSWGGAVQEIRKGDVVSIPPGVKHWHGAAPSSAMTHVAIAESLNGKAVDWMEKVTDDQYGGPNVKEKKPADQQPTAAQRLVGDVTPKLAQLTDDVLFADVWERPELSKRDRSLVTVAALVANGNTEQLRSHLQLAKTNGLTETKLSEAITHLAFYAGWPRAMSAAAVAKEVFKK